VRVVVQKEGEQSTLLIIEYSPGAESTTMQREHFPSPSPLLCEWKMSLTLVCHKYRTMEVIPVNAECQCRVLYQDVSVRCTNVQIRQE